MGRSAGASTDEHQAVMALQVERDRSAKANRCPDIHKIKVHTELFSPEVEWCAAGRKAGLDLHHRIKELKSCEDGVHCGPMIVERAISVVVPRGCSAWLFWARAAVELLIGRSFRMQRLRADEGVS